LDVPLVTITVEDEWNSVADAIAKFRLVPNYPRSSWDWIGLYKVNVVPLLATGRVEAEESTSANHD